MTTGKLRMPHPRALAQAALNPSTLVLLLSFVLIPPPAHPAQQSLYAKSVQSALARTTPNLEVLVLDLRTHEFLADTFPPTPIPAGSLFKPFLALAYAKTHSTPMPPVVCHGHSDRCWRDGGHGPITLTDAIAQSCNAFFLAVAANLQISDIPYLPAPPNSSPATLIGLNPDWRLAPRALAEAYAALLASPPTPTLAAVLAGMRGSATHGTSSRIGPHPGGVLAKTGTAPCIDIPCRITSDGLVVAAVPAAHPTLLLLVRKRGATGATTAASAGPILTQLESLHAE